MRIILEVHASAGRRLAHDCVDEFMGGDGELLEGIGHRVFDFISVVVSGIVGRRRADLWDVPFVIWLSPEYRAAFPETVEEIGKMALQPHRSDQLLGLFQTLARVKVAEAVK